MVRGGVVHDYRIDQGKVVIVRGGSIELLERDGTRQLIPVSPTAQVIVNGTLQDARRHTAAHERHHDQRRRPGSDIGPRDGAAAEVTAQGQASHLPAGRTGGTVLLVEDEEAIGAIVRTYLGRDGYRVVPRDPVRRRSRSSRAPPDPPSSCWTSACPASTASRSVAASAPSPPYRSSC